MAQVWNWLLANYLELFAFVTGVLGVWLTARQNIWCWPLGLINVSLSLVVFYFSKLYADVSLQVFYLVMTVYGWVNWKRGGANHGRLQIRGFHKWELYMIFPLGFAATALVGWNFASFTDAALPYMDSLVAVWGVLGTWVMARKVIWHWLIWIINDLICVGIYAYKELYFFTALYFIFTLLAVYGWIQWNKEWKKG